MDEENNLHLGYGLKVDMWAFGVTLHKLIYGDSHPYQSILRQHGVYQGTKVIKH